MNPSEAIERLCSIRDAYSAIAESLQGVDFEHDVAQDVIALDLAIEALEAVPCT